MSSASDIAVRVTGLSKKYRKGEYAHHSHVIDAIKGLNPFRSKEARMAAEAEHAKLDFWALKDMSFEVKCGEVLGVVGRNGAGKSTLLKVLSQITPPTEGRVEVQGRLGALLEVGTGFHPDLTGRENIFLNGAILGMTRSEIKEELDSIVDFSGVEEFIDTPVKRYSSGMYTRLAFAVAAHLRNEVLIVDEVLAVGDAEFQKKCLGKMQDVSKSGRTVLFVSHNTDSIMRLCTQVMYLEKGQVVEFGSDVKQIMNDYLFGTNQSESVVFQADPTKFDHPIFRPIAMALVGASGKPLSGGVTREDEVWLVIEGEVLKEDPNLAIGYYVYTDDGTCVYVSVHSDFSLDQCPPLKKGQFAVRTKLPLDFFNIGKYRIEFFASIHKAGWVCEPTKNTMKVDLEVTSFGHSVLIREGRSPGVIVPVLEWEECRSIINKEQK